MSKKMWLVRAGRNATLAQEFEERNYVAVGWIELADLSNVQSKESLEKLILTDLPRGKACQDKDEFRTDNTISL